MLFYLGWGFLVWLGATAIFRFTGHFFFIPEKMLWMALSYILVIPFILILTLPLYHLKGLKPEQKTQAAMLIALPGMLIDAIVLANYMDILPNLSPKADSFFGSWLLWAYSLILLTGFSFKDVKEK